MYWEDMKNVLLIGIGGVYNYGCEAIVTRNGKYIENHQSECAY